jgi:Ni/Fe-hydrogenase subunit HybB-like protein
MIDWELVRILACLLVALIIHELGHYIGFRIYGIKPKLAWHYGAVTIGEKEMYLLNSRQAVIVGLAGIIAGLIVIIITLPSLAFYLGYFIACSFDLSVIMMYAETCKRPESIYIIDTMKLEEISEAK